MKDRKLKIGKIPYANLYPIFYFLERKCRKSEYSFYPGVPSRLNRMLREGKLDISPSSSIEYLRNKNKYDIIPGNSISSTGPIRSILLFSIYPLEELGGKKIALSSESETSTVLLKIILQNFYSLKCGFVSVKQRNVKNILSNFSAVLHIGDTAMMEAKKLKSEVRSQKSEDKKRNKDSKMQRFYIYDLGEIWNRHTKLPFVFALWLERKDSLSDKKELLRSFSADLKDAKEFAASSLDIIARNAPQTEWISRKELVDYWKIISYDFTERHMKGLDLFEKLAKEIS